MIVGIARSSDKKTINISFSKWVWCKCL